jgi:hypothetical protein
VGEGDVVDADVDVDLQALPPVLELPGDGGGHGRAGRVEVGDVDDVGGLAVPFGAAEQPDDLGDGLEAEPLDVVGPGPAADRDEHVGHGRLLDPQLEQHRLVVGVVVVAAGVRRRQLEADVGQVVDDDVEVRQRPAGRVEADPGHVRRHLACHAMQDRVGVASVGDRLDVDQAEDAGRGAGETQPPPAAIGVQVRLAGREGEPLGVGVGDHPVVDAA